jgi:hypothetical protein
MIELAAHQRDAAERVSALLHRYGGAVLADEVGLGKSFVAAVVARDLQRCGWHVELVVPASLVTQWHETLHDFDVEGRVITHDSLLSDPFVVDPRRDRFLIVDEAHVFRNRQTQRYAALARRSISAPMLLVTATPICNSADDLFALVSLIAADDALRTRGVASIEQAFQRRDGQAIGVIIAELVIRRDRHVLPKELRFGDLKRRVIRHPVLDARTIDRMQFPLIGHHGLLRRLLWRRLESSEAALLESIRRQSRFYERALDCIARGRSLSKRDYRLAFGDEEERDAFQEVLFWEVFAPREGSVDAEEIRAELGRLDLLRQETEASPCSKRQILADLCAGNVEPALIFTGAVATARDLFNALRPFRRAGLITSRRAEPGNALDGFRRGGIDVLVCTDLAAEGLNLQRAGLVVHYDIPWNPVKLDQRNGRAWRMGQMRPAVEAIYFLPRRRCTRIVETVTAKNRARRKLLCPRLGEWHAGSSLVLPQRLTRQSAAVALIGALRRHGLTAPPSLARRYRAGVERLFEEMSHEYLDEHRLRDLLALLEGESRRTV